MTTFLYRTEDIEQERVLELYVPTSQDEAIVESLKAMTPVILQGSRGTGKSFLLRVAEAQLLSTFESTRVLPVYVTFARSSLLQSADPDQFRHWMLARLCTRLLRALYKHVLLSRPIPGINLLSGGSQSDLAVAGSQMDAIVAAYETSYQRPGQPVDSSRVPSVEALQDVIEDVCETCDIKRFVIFFDEAAHVFRPQQQRDFFTLFRDLRCPRLSCNAAVYPGLTSFGPTFQAAHDATLLQINRNVMDSAYVKNMREIVEKQADSETIANIDKNLANFEALAFAVSGNPRLLLKTVARAPRMNARDVADVLKTFYRTDIWTEHSLLGETYVGHRRLIDWGRDFIEGRALPDTKAKNDQWRREDKSESTCFIWVHKDAPRAVLEALALLEYTGIVIKVEAMVRSTRSELGARYALNLGCLFALDANPLHAAAVVSRTLTQRRFTEYGVNHAAFEALKTLELPAEPDIRAALDLQLVRPVSVLDITDYQKEKLVAIGLPTVGDILRSDESVLQQIYYVGEKRSRRMMNAAVSSVLEFLSG
jgi:hypothetical protein